MGSAFPDKHTATTKMCNERLELWRSSSKDRHYGGLAVSRETLLNETPHWQITTEMLQLHKRGTVLKRKDKHTLHKSHALLTAVEFATLEA